MNYFTKKIQELAPIIGAIDFNNVIYIFNYLKNDDLVVGEPDHLKGMINCFITMKGWQKFDQLNKQVNLGKNVFMAMKYGNSVLEKIYYENIVTAVKDTGFDLILLRDVLQAGSIDDQLRVQIKNAKFLIVDLTDGNNGAY
jgi:hypothetical protein